MSPLDVPSSADVVILGGGVGGLSCARRLARGGAKVVLLEARAEAGGLATGLTVAGTRVDGGPYVVLDRPGLAYAFEQLALDLDALGLIPIHHVYDVEQPGHPDFSFHADLEATIASLERAHPGSGPKYRAFVREMQRAHASLASVLTSPTPGPLAILRAGALGTVPLLLRSLGGVLRGSGLPPSVQQALGIWTHVAGQSLDDAPSPLAFAPAILHAHGASVPATGMTRIVDALVAGAVDAGATLIPNARVTRIVTSGGTVRGVDVTIDGVATHIACGTAVSNVGGVKTLLELVPVAARTAAWARSLPLQSPGLAAYGVTKRAPAGPYLRFRLRGDAEDPVVPARLVVRPSAVDASFASDGLHPVRLVLPLAHHAAERLSDAEHRALLERALEDPWWRDQVDDVVVEHRRVPATWGAEFGLHRNAMNPVMTAKFMREGRMPHRVKDVDGLFLVGSSTHPGQWVSFCAVSGILVADAVSRRLRG